MTWHCCVPSTCPLRNDSRNHHLISPKHYQTGKNLRHFTEVTKMKHFRLSTEQFQPRNVKFETRSIPNKLWMRKSSLSKISLIKWSLPNLHSFSVFISLFVCLSLILFLPFLTLASCYPIATSSSHSFISAFRLGWGWMGACPLLSFYTRFITTTFKPTRANPTYSPSSVAARCCHCCVESRSSATSFG